MKRSLSVYDTNIGKEGRICNRPIRFLSPDFGHQTNTLPVNSDAKRIVSEILKRLEGTATAYLLLLSEVTTGNANKVIPYIYDSVMEQLSHTPCNVNNDYNERQEMERAQEITKTIILKLFSYAPNKSPARYGETDLSTDIDAICQSIFNKNGHLNESEDPARDWPPNNNAGIPNNESNGQIDGTKASQMKNNANDHLITSEDTQSQNGEDVQPDSGEKHHRVRFMSLDDIKHTRETSQITNDPSLTKLPSISFEERKKLESAEARDMISGTNQELTAATALAKIPDTTPDFSHDPQDWSWILGDSPLVTAADRIYLSDAMFAALAQFHPVAFQESDLSGRRQFPIGFMGVACKHCHGSTAGKSGRFFPKNANMFAHLETEKNFLNHMTAKCQHIPRDIRCAIIALQKKEQKRAWYGSRNAIFCRMWSRLHSESKNAVK